MNKEELEKERLTLLSKVREIEAKLNLIESLTLDEIAEKVKQFTGGIAIKEAGKKCKRQVTEAKQLFWRYAFTQGYSSIQLGRYVGFNNRFTALAGKRAHFNKCQKDVDVNQEWQQFKQFMKNG